MTVYLIYLIPEKELQAIILTIVAALYGGLITLVGVAWTIKKSDKDRKADEILKKADEEAKPLYHQICEIYDKANKEIDKIVSEAKEKFEEEKKKYAETIVYDDELVGLLKLFKWL